MSSFKPDIVCSDSGDRTMQLERDLSDLEKVTCAIRGWYSFTTGHSCLGTLNCLFSIVQEWVFIISRILASASFKGRSHLHQKKVDC